MANNIIRRVWNQNRMVNIEDLTGAAFQAENGGHTFEISGVDDGGNAVELSGTVSGVFRRPDNADIALTGSASDGVVSVTLSEDCYAVPGRFGLTIFVTSNSQKVAVYACVGTVAVSSTGNVAGDTPASVEDLIDDINAAIADLNSAIGQIPASYANVMAAIAPTYSGSALYPVGAYAWYNGSLYRCTTAITTAETWTAAHWTAAVLGGDVADLKSATTTLQDVAIIQVEIDSLQHVVPFIVHSGDSIIVSAKDGTDMTVSYIRLLRADGTNDYWSISGYASRTIAITEEFVGVFATGGTAQDLIVKKTGSYLNFQPQIDEVKAEADENTSTLTKVKEIVGIDEPTYAVTTGKYISYDGNITSGSAFEYSAPIEVKEGQKVVLVGEGYNTAVAMISLSNAAGTTITPKVISKDSTVRTYEYDVLADGYIIVCYYRTHQHKLTIYTDKIGTLERTVDKIADYSIVEPQTLNAGFIHRDGRIMEGPNFRYTNPIRLENETIQFRAKGYSDIVSLLSTCDQNGGNRENIVNSTSSEVENITFSSDGVTYVIITSNVTVPIVYTSTKNILPSSIPYVNLSMFDKFGVVGDSYASGALFFNDTEKDDYAHSWGQIMARNLGTTCTNYSKGGLSTRTWLTDNKGLSLMQASDPEDIYYLALGINDYYSLGDAYLGEITDITSHSSYTEYPDTFYGNYGKIIEQIQAHAPNAKMVLFTIAAITPNQTRDAYNSAIIEIANHYGIPYIVQNDDPFFMSYFYNKTKVEGHPIAITYSGMASAFERLLVQCIKNNVAYFRNTYWYN